MTKSASIHVRSCLNPSSAARTRSFWCWLTAVQCVDVAVVVGVVQTHSRSKFPNPVTLQLISERQTSGEMQWPSNSVRPFLQRRQLASITNEPHEKSQLWQFAGQLHIAPVLVLLPTHSVLSTVVVAVVVVGGNDGNRVGVAVKRGDGNSVGTNVGGLNDGVAVGVTEGSLVSLCEGNPVGNLDGATDGVFEGPLVGFSDGPLVGECEGCSDGANDGCLEGAVDGEADGLADGCLLGICDGAAVGA